MVDNIYLAKWRSTITICFFSGWLKENINWVSLEWGKSLSQTLGEISLSLAQSTKPLRNCGLQEVVWMPTRPDTRMLLTDYFLLKAQINKMSNEPKKNTDFQLPCTSLGQTSKSQIAVKAFIHKYSSFYNMFCYRVVPFYSFHTCPLL